MPYYMISFNDGTMVIPDDDLPTVARDAMAVVQAARDAGVYVFAAGLLDPSQTSVVAMDGRVTDGRPAHVRDFLGGFTIVDVPTREDALHWAHRLAVACRCAQDVRECMAEPAQ
jgi:hypothetical protein